jgi:hypothetical protein
LSENYILAILSVLRVTMAYDRGKFLAMSNTRNLARIRNIAETTVKIASHTIIIRSIVNNLQHYNIPKIKLLPNRARGDIIHDI